MPGPGLAGTCPVRQVLAYVDLSPHTNNINFDKKQSYSDTAAKPRRYEP